MVSITFDGTSLLVLMLAVLAVLVGIDQYMLFSIGSGTGNVPVTGNAVAATSGAMGVDGSGAVPEAAASQGSGPGVAQGTLLPYGVTFDQAGYDKLIGYDNSINKNTMTGEQWQRYIKIGTGDRTGCGACCGIGNGPAIDASGNSRCGCGHIHALEGLMKYLVTSYGDKYTDAQIFGEVVKWKKLFFPGQIADDGSVIK